MYNLWRLYNRASLLTYYYYSEGCINLLKPTGYMMHHQFNIQ
jgi:hypothetical protein